VVVAGFARDGAFEEEPVYMLALEQVFGDEFLAISGVYAYVEGIVGINLDDGALFAKTETTHFKNGGLVADTVFFERGDQRVLHFKAAGRNATRTTADENL
jgi:hypothetical protein